MSKILRLTIFASTLAGLASVWFLAGPLPAMAACFSIIGYLFVLSMKIAAEEILRFEREQRPDLYA